MMGMVEEVGEQHSSYRDGSEIAVEADGSFEILLAPERPRLPTIGTWKTKRPSRRVTLSWR